MPGDFTLGALLGPYDKAQSFDVASGNWSPTGCGSWAFATSQSSGFPQATDVHSSGQGLKVSVGSGPTGVMAQYNYTDAGDVLFTEVATHSIFARFWARNDTPVASGQTYCSDIGNAIKIVIGANSLMLPYGASQINVSSAVGARFTIVRALAGTTSAQNTFIDDVLVAADWIPLRPEWEFDDSRELFRQQHRSQGGKLFTYDWAGWFKYKVPLRYLPSSHADLINWWWSGGFNLVATLDTSDSGSVRIVRITNASQPITKRESPYMDQWAGMLELESIDPGSLVF
jgi:hypothetical protein